jgi:hypothetical protein
MARPPKRDRTFLLLATIAAIGGVLSIATSIGLPFYAWAHGGHPQPTYVLFSAWGMAALAGCAANIYVYFQSGPPPGKPPRGGQRVTQLRALEARAKPTPIAEQERRAA